MLVVSEDKLARINELAKKAKRVVTLVDGNIVHDTKFDADSERKEK